MIKLNSLQFPTVLPLEFDEKITMQPLKDNSEIEEKITKFASSFGFNKLQTFKFSKEGILALMLNLKGKILVSLGESENIVQGGKLFKDLGGNIEFIPLTKEGTLEYEKIEKCDYIFCSAYIMDTYVKVDLQRVKLISEAVIISNISATMDVGISDMAILDAYKLTGYSLDSILLYNSNEFEGKASSEISTISIFQIDKSICNITKNTTNKSRFLEALNGEFKSNIFYFVNPKDTLEYTLHFGLKGIKAREIIRTLALSSIYVTNGEGCSLGLSRPSRIIQEMTYTETESRWALSLNFCEELDDETITKVVQTIGKKYRQIIALND